MEFNKSVSAEDVRIVREALIGAYPEIDPRFKAMHKEALDALARLEARIAEVERERDEWKDAFARRADLSDRHAARAEAAERELRLEREGRSTERQWFVNVEATLREIKANGTRSVNGHPFLQEDELGEIPCPYCLADRALDGE